jgi:hypothetical protein
LPSPQPYGEQPPQGLGLESGAQQFMGFQFLEILFLFKNSGNLFKVQNFIENEIKL